MKVNLSTKPPQPKEDPLLEKLTNSLVIAFFAAAIIKIVTFLYSTFWVSSSAASGSITEL